jgi:hypothetical protein
MAKMAGPTKLLPYYTLLRTYRSPLKNTSSDLNYRVMLVWITRRANYLDLK